MSLVILEIRVDSVKLSVCALERYDMRLNRSWRSFFVTLPALFVAILFAVILVVTEAAAHKSIITPHVTISFMSFCGTISSSITSSTYGIIKSIIVAKNLMMSPSVISPA